MTGFNWHNPYPTTRIPVFARNVVPDIHAEIAWIHVTNEFVRLSRSRCNGGRALARARPARSFSFRRGGTDDWLQLAQPYPTTRIPVFARNVVSTSHSPPRRLRMLWKGGRAERVGVAPAAWNVDYFRKRHGEAGNGIANKPTRGWDTVTVPGVIAGWEAR